MNEKYVYQPDSAEAFRKLGIKGTSYEMAFAEIERMFGDVRGKEFLDFGSGAGRSARFLKGLGASKVIGVDHNQNMVLQSRLTYEEGLEFHLITDKIPLPDNSIDHALSNAAFVEMKTLGVMQRVSAEIFRVLKAGGCFVLGTANPESFGHDFKNYSKLDNPKYLKSGDVTNCTMKGEKPFVIEDVYWTEEDYSKVLKNAGFIIDEVAFPKAIGDGDWLDEVLVAPEMIFKCRKV